MLALAVIALAGLPAVVLVAAPRLARAATAGVAALPGTPYVWGLNGDGELGTATTATCSGYLCSPTPLALSALPNVRAAAGGDLHTIVATADGSVYTWGSNEAGQLGVTTQQTCYGQPCSTIPVQVAGLPTVVEVAAGADDSLALTSSDALYAWGGNSGGDLGIGTMTSAASPVLVTGLPSAVVRIAADGQDSMALTASGQVYAWGDNTYGQLGTASTGVTCGSNSCSPTPLLVSGLPSDITDIAVGAGYNLALASMGTVYAWGDNTYGTLGNGSTTNSATPVPVAQVANATAIAAGESAMALTSGGAVYAWGDDMFGELGSSSSKLCGNGYPCGLTPVQVGGLPAGIVAVAAGGGFNLALAGDSMVWSWGENTIGQLGNGSSDPNPHPTPAQISGLSGVGALATGSHHAIAIVPPAGSPSPTPTGTPPPAPAATLSTTFIDFGTQQVGTTSAPTPVTLSNTGTATLNVTGAALSGANPGDYVLAGGTCASASGGTTVQIAPGGSCTMSISFAPTAIGTRTGTLTVACDAANCPLSGSVTGNAINPSGSISPTSINFPDTTVGSFSQAPVLLDVCDDSVGTTNLIITNASFSGANPGDFFYSIVGSGSLPLTVTPGDCASFLTTFAPTAAGARSADLTFATNDSLHMLSATLSGNGLVPSGTINPTAVSFPDTAVGSSSTAPGQITVCDAGLPSTGDLVINAISLGGSNPGDFSYSISGTLPLTLHAGNCLAVATTFTPTAAGARSAAMVLATNDSAHTLSATLSGNGVVPADVGVTLSESPNPVKSGARLTYTITVANQGPGVSSGVQVSDALPAGTTFANVATTAGTCSAPAVGGTGTVSCTASSLANGASFTVTLVVNVTVRPPTSTTITDTASVSASTPDPNTANNLASVTTTVTKH
jgi:uncharacterized repeat protein (TIGR01451 family)